MAERKTRSLYGRQIQEALKRYLRPQLRSEELPSFRPYFVDLHLLEQIHNNSNQLIVGRRGTGKTHLLGAFHEMIRDDCPTEMSIMISMMEVVPRSRHSAVNAMEMSQTVAANALFESFLHVFFDKFIVEAERRLKHLRGSRTLTREEDAKANNLLERLLEAIELGAPMATRKATSSTTVDTSDTGSRLGLGVEAGIGLSGVRVGLSGSAGGSKQNGHVRETKTEVSSLLAVDLYAVRTLLDELLKLLRLETFYILIDEWMELDKKAVSGIQPVFAQLLKAAFFNNQHLAVKIASVWHQTTLYDRADMAISQGVELKHDIAHAFDLDTEFMTTPEEARAFCKGILFKRLANMCPDLLAFERDDGEVDDVFVTELFDNDENFRAFIAASHGIPRDIMMIFQRCSLRIKRDFERQCISHDQIFEVAKRSYMTEKRRSIDSTSAPQKLLTGINEYLEKTGHRIFLVVNDEALKSSALRKLVDEELVHQIPSAVTPRCIQDTHKSFLIDFGNFADWVTARRHDLSRLLSETVLPQFPAEFEKEWKSYVIDVGAADDAFIRCSECCHDIATDHPVLRRLRSCPHCAVPIAQLQLVG